MNYGDLFMICDLSNSMKYENNKKKEPEFSRCYVFLKVTNIQCIWLDAINTLLSKKHTEKSSWK